MFNKSIWWFNKISKEINQSYKKKHKYEPENICLNCTYIPKT